MRLTPGAALSLALILLLTLLLVGCGQKGPLYLPDDKAAAERYGIPEQTQDAAAEDVSDPPQQQAAEPPATDNKRDS